MPIEEEFEKAAAEVATDAGKSLVRGIERTFGALTAEWIAKKWARADASRLAIETEAEIDRANALTDARRERELTEENHQFKLAKRRFERTMSEMAHQQENFESITGQSLALIESDPSDSQASELDEEWLFQFAEFAEKISDKDLQRIWARVLRSASIKGEQKLSTASLLQLALIDRTAALDFEKVCRVIYAFRTFPAHERFYVKNSLDIDVIGLEELGLIKRAQPGSLRMNDAEFRMTTRNLGLRLSHVAFDLTRKGAEIATAIFYNTAGLSAAEEDDYLQDLVNNMLRVGDAVMITLPTGNAYAGIHRAGTVEPLAPATLQQVLDNGVFTERIARLLRWAKDHYSITLGSGEPGG